MSHAADALEPTHTCLPPTRACLPPSSQAHLLKNSDYNPLPTAVPPPIAAVAGTLGVRHVLSLIGLPQRGKPFIAKRLKSYLSFFHGAEVALFDVSSYAERSGAPAGSDENAQLLLDELKEFMEEKSSQAGMNMDVSSSRGNGSDGDTMSDERGSDEVAHANTPPRQHSDEGDEATRLVDETDRRRKHVDSGKVAILYSTDSFGSFTEQWSGTSKERRQVSHTQVSHTSLSHTHLSHKSLTHVSYTRLSHKSLTQVSHTILTTFNTQLLSHTHIVPGITAMYLTAMYLCATHHPSICISHRDASLFFSI